MPNENAAMNQMIDLVGEKDYEAATGMFNGMMADKLTDALDQEKIKVADAIYNNVEAPEVLEVEANPIEGDGVADPDGDE